MPHIDKSPYITENILHKSKKMIYLIGTQRSASVVAYIKGIKTDRLRFGKWD
jgi:hypothetical protein